MSMGNTPSLRVAEAITLLRSDRHTIPGLARSTGTHRQTMVKLISALQAGGHVRPSGSEKRGRAVALLWEWAEAPPITVVRPIVIQADPLDESGITPRLTHLESF